MNRQVCVLLGFPFLYTFRIHPPDVIGKYAPDSVIGMIGGGGGGGAVAAAGGGGGGGISMAEVAKHNSKTDCWVPRTKGVFMLKMEYIYIYASRCD